MQVVPYTSIMGSLIYTMLCTRLDICFVVGMESRYRSNLGPENWTTIKHILKLLGLNLRKHNMM